MESIFFRKYRIDIQRVKLADGGPSKFGYWANVVNIRSLNKTSAGIWTNKKKALTEARKIIINKTKRN